MYSSQTVGSYWVVKQHQSCHESLWIFWIQNILAEKNQNVSAASLRSALEWQAGQMILYSTLLIVENGFILEKHGFSFQTPSQMDFWTSQPQRTNIRNAEMSQADAIFSQTTDQPNFPASKVERAAATDPFWLSMSSYKKDQAQWGPLKASWLRAQWDKTPTAACVSGSHLPSSLCTWLCCEACPGVVFRLDGGQKVFRHTSCWCFLIPCIFILRAVCPSYHQDAMEPFSGESASRAEFPLKVLPNKQPSDLPVSPLPAFCAFAECFIWAALFVRQLLQNVSKVAEQQQVQWCWWLTAGASIMWISPLLFSHIWTSNQFWTTVWLFSNETQ